MTTDRFELRKASTKEAIQQAFVTLLDEKTFDEITVRQISEQAGVGFKTYYRHYKDKKELTHAIVLKFIEALSRFVEPPLTYDAHVRNLRIVLRFAKENKTVMRAIGRTPARDDLIQPMIQFGFLQGRRMQSSASETDSSEGKMRRELITHHFVHSQLSLIFWWVDKDLSVPIDEMEEMIIGLIIRPIWNLTDSNS